MAVSMDVDDEMRRASKAATDAVVGQQVSGAIYNLTSDWSPFLLPPSDGLLFCIVQK